MIGWSTTPTVVRETVNEDNDPVAGTTFPLPGVELAPRLPQPDSASTGERVTATYDAWHPDRDVDIRGTDRVRLPGEPTEERARWTVEGEPARSPWPAGGCVFVLQRERG